MFDQYPTWVISESTKASSGSTADAIMWSAWGPTALVRFATASLSAGQFLGARCPGDTQALEFLGKRGQAFASASMPTVTG